MSRLSASATYHLNEADISRFEQKIQATLAIIWGEDESANGAKPYQPGATPQENNPKPNKG